MIRLEKETNLAIWQTLKVNNNSNYTRYNNNREINHYQKFKL